MSLAVRFDGDPTFWSLKSPVDPTPLVNELASSKDPISVSVTGPLVGTMLISPRCVGSMAILDEDSIGSWIPSGVEAPSAVLYVPTATGPTAQFPGYALPAGTNLTDLGQEILGAMKSGEVITTPIGTASKGSGQLRIYGGALAFAVVAEQSSSAATAGQ